MAVVESSELERRFESERIHASPRVLLLAAIGLAVYGVGRLIGLQPGNVVASIGMFFIVIALVLHFDHLSFRIGRSAVVLVILAAIAEGLGALLRILDDADSRELWLHGSAYILGGVAAGAVAVHKERQMKAMLDEYAAGAPWQTRVTVHASFLALITVACGMVLYGIGLIGLTTDGIRAALILMTIGALLVAIGVISHIEHLVPRLGVVVVGAVILAVLVFAANPLRDLFSSTADLNDHPWWELCLGISALLGSLACIIALQKKRSSDLA